VSCVFVNLLVIYTTLEMISTIFDFSPVVDLRSSANCGFDLFIWSIINA
jgi:hypothetical protein